MKKWKNGNMEIWKFGIGKYENMEIWKNGNME